MDWLQRRLLANFWISAGQQGESMHAGLDQNSAFRLQGLPTIHEDHPLRNKDVIDLVLRALQPGDAVNIDFGIEVKSLALDPSSDSNMIATLHFTKKMPPQVLKTMAQHTVFDIHGDGGGLQLDTDFLGITPLHSAFTGPANLIVVAVTGLGGHAFGSFKQRGAKYMWLRDDLPRHFPNANIYTWGINTGLRGSDSFQSLEDLGLSFKNALKTVFGDGDDDVPLVLIGHSLGGLIIKNALIDMQSHRNDVDLIMLRALRMLMFFGTPNQGMKIESLWPIVEGRANEDLLRSLGPDSPQLRTQAKEWDRFFRTRLEEPTYAFQVISYYETRLSPTAMKDNRGSYTMTGPKARLVDRNSATHGAWDSGSEVIVQIDRDHSGLVKFRGSQDSEYKEKVRKYFHLCLGSGKQRPFEAFVFDIPFFGREQDLVTMECFFSKKASGVPALVVRGHSGMGKSWLAKKYASECAKRGDWIVVIDAQTDDSFAQSASAYVDQDVNVVGALHRALSRRRSPWVLILDDLHSTKFGLSETQHVHAETLWKTLQHLPNGKLIVTTSRLPESIGFLRDCTSVKCIELQGLTQTSGMQLFNNATRNGLGPSTEEEENMGTRNLLRVLGGHPLSIVLVAGYIVQMRMSSKDYLSAFQEKLSKYIARTDTDHSDELQRSLHTIWRTSVEVVKVNCPAAISILEAWSFLHNNGFSFDLLSGYSDIQGTSPELCTLVKKEGNGTCDFTDAMLELRSFSLISTSFSNPSLYDMPSVFHNWCRKALVKEPSKDHLLSILQCLGMVVPDRKDEGYMKKTMEILPHVSASVDSFYDMRKESKGRPGPRCSPIRTFQDHRGSDPTGKELAQANAMLSIVEVFRSQEKLEQATMVLYWCKKILTAAPESKAKQQAAPGLKEVSGNLHKDKRQYQEARKDFEEALKGFVELHGDTNDATIGARSNLGSIYAKLHMKHEAEAEFKRVLAARTTSEDSRKLKLDCKQRYANLLMGWKERPHAREQAIASHQQILQTCREWHGKDDYRTARAAYNLAHSLVQIDELRPAEKLYEEFLPVLERHLPDHNLLFNAQNGYGHLLTKLKAFSDADVWLRKARDGFERRDGRKSVGYAQVTAHVGDLRVAEGLYNDAEACYREMTNESPEIVKSSAERLRYLRRLKAQKHKSAGK